MCTSDIKEKSRAEQTAFVFPLAGGTLPFWLLTRKRGGVYPETVARNLYHSGIVTLTVGSIVRGILDIYGTTNTLSGYYFMAGWGLVIIGVFLYIFAVGGGKRERNS